MKTCSICSSKYSSNFIYSLFYTPSQFVPFKDSFLCSSCFEKWRVSLLETHLLCLSPELRGTIDKETKGVAHKDYLYKKLRAGNTWRRLWCHLTETRLLCFCSQEDEEYQIPFFTIDLRKATLQPLIVSNEVDASTQEEPLLLATIEITEEGGELTCIFTHEKLENLKKWWEALTSKRKPAPELVECIKRASISLPPYDWEELPKSIHHEEIFELPESCIDIKPQLTFGGTMDSQKNYFLSNVSRLWSNQVQTELLSPITTSPFPSHLPNEFNIWLILSNKSTQKKVNKELTVKEIISDFMNDLIETEDNRANLSFLHDPKRYILRPYQYKEYIPQDVSLESLEYVRDCLNKNQPILLKLTDTWDLKSPVSTNMKQKGLSFIATPQTSKEIESYNSKYVRKPLCLRVKSLTITNDSTPPHQLRISAHLYYGPQLLSTTSTNIKTSSSQLKFDEWLIFHMDIADLPAETRLILVTEHNFGKDWSFGDWIVLYLFDFQGRMRTGHLGVNMWPFQANETHDISLLTTVATNEDYASKPKMIELEFERSPLPIIHRQFISSGPRSDDQEPPIQDIADANVKQVFVNLLHSGPLHPLAEVDKKMIWIYRHLVKKLSPFALSKVVQSVTCTNPHQIQLLHNLISDWELIDPIYALELLDVRHPDQHVREFAVRSLKILSDQQIADYLPQLIQIIKIEKHDYSPVLEFVLARAVKSFLIGHRLWWQLQAEANDKRASERVQLILAAYQMVTSSSLSFTNNKYPLDFMAKLTAIASQVKQMESDRTPYLRKLLRSTWGQQDQTSNSNQDEDVVLKIPKLRLPLHPRYEISGILVDGCRVMNSNTRPLLLTLILGPDNPSAATTTPVPPHNNELSNMGSPAPPSPTESPPLQHKLQVMMKTGDDLRTDMLALQILRTMDIWWKKQGLDLLLEPYGAINTGYQAGMIEIVPHAETIANIQSNYSGKTTGTFDEKIVESWLRSHNPQEEVWEKARKRFILSCAGYCVATYVLGVGDRHNDNYMLTKRGNFFHIDFGYVLGNRTTFLGFSRETAKFVLLPAFVRVMGGPDSRGYHIFVKTACRAFAIVRRHAHVLMTLLMLMLPAGMPQLYLTEHLRHVEDSLLLDLTEQEACNSFVIFIEESLNNRMTSWNNFAHVLNRTPVTQVLYDVSSDVYRLIQQRSSSLSSWLIDAASRHSPGMPAFTTSLFSNLAAAFPNTFTESSSTSNAIDKEEESVDKTSNADDMCSSSFLSSWVILEPPPVSSTSPSTSAISPLHYSSQSFVSLKSHQIPNDAQLFDTTNGSLAGQHNRTSNFVDFVSHDVFSSRIPLMSSVYLSNVSNLQ